MNRDSLHIAHYTNVYKPMKNGVVSSVESLRKGQLEQGHSVYVVAPAPRDKSYQQERFVFNVPAITLPQQEYPFALPYDPTITRLLRGLRPDLLHTHHPVGLGRYARLWSQRLGVPLIFTFHTWYEDFSHYFSNYFSPYIPLLREEHVARLMRFWIRKFIKQCHHIVAPSSHTRSRILQAYGDVVKEDSVSVVPTGIDYKAFSKYRKEEARQALGWSPDKPYLVSCGRLSREKNFHLLLDAVSRMQEGAKLVILGEGDLRGALEKQINRLGLQDRVELPGNVSRDQVACHFAAADLFCFASPNETQGLVVLEAMAAGTPTVVVRGGGVNDFVTDGVNGIMADTDPLALSRAFDRALAIKDFGRLRERARETALELSETNQARRMSEVYTKALSSQRVACSPFSKVQRDRKNAPLSELRLKLEAPTA